MKEVKAEVKEYNGKLIWWIDDFPAPIAYEAPTATNFYNLAEAERFRLPASRLVCDLKTELAKS